MKKTSAILWLSFLTLFVQCRNNQKDNEPVKTEITQEVSNYNFDYAKTIALEDHDKTIDYIIKIGGDEKRTEIDKAILPLKNMVILSSSSIGFLSELDQLSSVEAVYGAQWMYNPDLHAKIKQGQIKDEGNIGSLNLEKILSLNPDAIIAFSDPNQSKLYTSLEQVGILVIYVDEYMEETPLGKSEFIKLYGLLTGEYEKSKEIFDEVEKNYLHLKSIAAKEKIQPSVFAEIMRGDVWYMPGGNSFAAQYFDDANANYLWSEDDNKGSIQLNFEQVFAKAGSADIWLNAADLQSLNQLENAYKNHNWFDAFKAGKVYSIFNRHNEAGANDYFETGTVRADWVLKDLIKICHPNLLPDHQLYYYHQLD